MIIRMECRVFFCLILIRDLFLATRFLEGEKVGFAAMRRVEYILEWSFLSCIGTDTSIQKIFS